jgi:hypothetical protein
MLMAAKVVAPAVTATSILLYHRFEPNERGTTKPILLFRGTCEAHYYPTVAHLFQEVNVVFTAGKNIQCNPRFGIRKLNKLVA